MQLLILLILICVVLLIVKRIKPSRQLSSIDSGKEGEINVSRTLNMLPNDCLIINNLLLKNGHHSFQMIVVL